MWAFFKIKNAGAKKKQDRFRVQGLLWGLGFRVYLWFIVYSFGSRTE
jgi:hypothetical protein